MLKPSPRPLDRKSRANTDIILVYWLRTIKIIGKTSRYLNPTGSEKV